MIAAGAVVVLAEAARGRRSTARRASVGYDAPPPVGRRHFFVAASSLGNVLFLDDRPAERPRRRRPRAVPPVVRRAARSLLLALAAAPARAAQPPHGVVTNVRDGAALYAANCASCHGATGEGVAPPGIPGAGGVVGMGPSLRNVGAGTADFYLRTGYMPLGDPDEQPCRRRVLFDRAADPRARRATSRRSAPARRSRSRTPSAASVAEGMRLFTDHCAGCHQVVARGGVVDRRARAAARRRDAGADRRGGAHRAVRDAALLDARRSRDAQLDSIVALRRVREASRTTAAAGRSATSGRCRRASSRGCSPRPRSSPPASLLGNGGRAREPAAGLARRRRRPAARPRPPRPRAAARTRHRRAHARRTPAGSSSPRCSSSRRPRRRSRSRSSTRSTSARLTQLLGLVARRSRSCSSRSRCIVIAKRVVVTEELAEHYPPPARRPSRTTSRRSSRRRATRSRAGACSCSPAAPRSARSASRSSRPPPRSARCSTSIRSSGRRGGAGAGSSTSTAAPLPRGRDRAEGLLHGVPGGRRPRAVSARRSSSSGSTRASSTCRRSAQGWAPRGHRRLLEDLHARGLRGRALPHADVRAGRAEAGARLPVPLLDVRPGRRAASVLFGPAGRPLPQLPLADRRARRPARRRQLLRARSARRGGACATGRPKP